MFAETRKRAALRLTAVFLLAAMLFTACASGAPKAADYLELGQRYLTEMNYSEAVAQFTEAIRLDPNDIQAYLGRAQAYEAMGEYEKALADYEMAAQLAEDVPYTLALACSGQAAMYEALQQPEQAADAYALAAAQLNADDAGTAEGVDREKITAQLVLVLRAHAALCVTLERYQDAQDDYSTLTDLGQDVKQERDALQKKLDEAENGLDTPADPEEPDADSGEEPADTEDADLDAEPEEAEKQSAASGTEAQPEIPAAQGPVKPAAFVHEGQCSSTVFWGLDAAGTLYIYGSGALEDWDEDDFWNKFEPLRLQIKKIQVEEGITRLGAGVFAEISPGPDDYRHYDNLTEIRLPDTLESLGSFFMSGCSRVETIAIPASVKTIEENAFYIEGDFNSDSENGKWYLRNITVDPANPYFTAENGALFDKSKTRLIQYCPAAPAASYTVPATVTQMDERAFENCLNLHEVTLSDDLTVIPVRAFYWCKNLTTVQMPKNLKSIEYAAFRWCGLTSAVIPEGTEKIGGEAFFSCKKMTLLVIPRSVKYIGESAFAFCPLVPSVTISRDCEVGFAAFDYDWHGTINYYD